MVRVVECPVSIVFGPDPVLEAVQEVLSDLGEGRAVHERLRVDLKEEAGRHDRSGYREAYSGQLMPTSRTAAR